MIRIGLSQDEKESEIKSYIDRFNIKQVFIFYPELFPLTYEQEGISVECVEYKDIIMYKYFYRLLEVIDDDTLLIFNECMRTQNRSDLTYNCAHHYCNQTPHKIVFEYFPFIEQPNDFMILLDFINKGKYRGRSFKSYLLHDEDIAAKKIEYTIETIDIDPTEDMICRYEKEREKLFDNLGQRDPDTIPRNLHVFVGNMKKDWILPNVLYIARNARFRMPNVATYRTAVEDEYTVIDFPHRRIDFNDFLKLTKMRNIRFINSSLKVDLYYLNELREWTERLGEFYAEAGVYTEERA